MRSRGLSLIPLVAMAIAGCGGGGASSNGIASKPGSAVVDAARAAALAARTVHVVGDLVTGGQRIRFDLHLQSGNGAKGSISQGDYTFQLVRIGQDAYIQGGAPFYRHLGGTAGVQLLAGKWLKAPPTDPQLASLFKLTDPQQLFTAFLKPRAGVTNAGSTVVAGHKAVRLTGGGNDGELDVASTGQPYPLRLASTGSDAGSITFDSWNAPVSLAAPPGAIDIAQLKGR